MTKLELINGTVYTELPLGEVRMYLQKGHKGGTIEGYKDEAKTTPILIHTGAIQFIYR